MFQTRPLVIALTLSDALPLAHAAERVEVFKSIAAQCWPLPL